MGLPRIGAQGHSSDQTQASPAAAEQAHQVVAGHVFHHSAAGAGSGAIGAQYLDADQLIAKAQVALPQPAREPAGHEAAHASGVAAAPGWIHRQPLVGAGQLRLQGLER